MALPTLDNKIDTMIVELADNEMFTNYFDDVRNVDIDMLYENARMAMQKTGKVRIPKFGVVLDVTDVEKLNNSVKELISNSGDYKVGEIVGWDDTEKLLSIVQELDNYDVLKSLGLSEGAIQEEEGKIKRYFITRYIIIY